MVLVRTDQGKSLDVRELFDSDLFQYRLQDALGDLLKAELRQANVNFNEVIISLDAPAAKAKQVQKKSSFMGRFFGKE
jgi:hypothetical protein